MTTEHFKSYQESMKKMYEKGKVDGRNELINEFEKLLEDWYLRNRKDGVAVGFHYEHLIKKLQELKEKK